MKTVIAFILALVCFNISYAQLFVDGFEMDESVKYCKLTEIANYQFNRQIEVINEQNDSKILATNFVLSKKETKIYIDFGQPIDWSKPQRFHDYADEAYTFYGIMDMLNILYEEGWEYVSNHHETLDGVSITHFIIKKKEGNLFKGLRNN